MAMEKFRASQTHLGRNTLRSFVDGRSRDQRGGNLTLNGSQKSGVIQGCLRMQMWGKEAAAIRFESLGEMLRG